MKNINVLVLDPAVRGADVLLAGLDPTFDVITLPETGASGLAALALSLRGYSGIERLHVLSHGSPGTLDLAAGRLDEKALLAQPGLAATISEVLAPDAEVVLYGCAVASGAPGAAFVDLLSRLVGCRVWASESTVGAGDLGGRWDLPAERYGFDEASRAAYPGLLASSTVTFGVVTTLNLTTTLTVSSTLINETNAITIDVTRSDGTAMAGVSSGFLDAGVIGSAVSYTLVFGTAINITQFQIGEFKNNTTGSAYSFTPNTGTAVTIADDAGAIAGAIATLTAPDWVGVTSMTVSYGGADTWRVGLDNISFTLSGPAAPGTPDLIATADSGSSSTDNITNIALPTVSGTAVAGNGVHILVGGVTVGSTTADGGGAWTFAFSTTLAAGTHAITAIQDTGSAESTASTALNIVVDTVAGTLAAPDLAAASDTGSSNTDNITTDGTPTIEGGSAEALSTISILNNGATVGTATASTLGAWSFTLTATLADGSYAITALQTDAAGNTGVASSALNIVVDTTAPLTLATPDLLAASDLGVSSTDNITSSATQQLSGSATTGDQVSILVGGTTSNVVTAAGGSWSYTHTLTQGSYAVTVQVTDAAGNVGPASTALGITIDTTAPGTIGTPDLLASSDTGSSNTDNITSASLPTVQGTGAVANSLVHILVGGATVGSVTATAGGAWTYTFTATLAAGTSAVTAVTEDIAGNDGPASTALNIFVDTVSATLGTPDLLAASDTGNSNTDNITNSATQQLSGSATTGDTVHILVGGVTVNNVTAAGGSWSYTHTLTAGSYAITVSATDTAGNVGAASTALGLTIDTTAPATLGAPDLLAASDLGVSSIDNITSSATQQLSGSATTGDRVSILVGGTTSNVVTAAGGSWSYTHTLTEGSYAVTVQVTDAAGNVGPASAALGIVIDTTAPTGTVGTPDLIASSDLGASSTDNVTSSRLPTVSGTGAIANSLVHILVGGVTSGSVTASSAGAWTFTFTSTLAGGTAALTARSEDIAGNDSTVTSTALNIVIDATAPAAPVTLATPDMTAASDNGASATDNNTTVATPVFVGTNTTGSTLHSLLANGVTVGTFTSEAGGTYSVTASSLAVASYAITIREVDTAGNSSTDSPALNIVIGQAASTNNDSGGGGGGGSTTTTTTSVIVVTPTTPTTTVGGTATNASNTITNNGTAAGSAAIVENTNNNGNVVTATLPPSTTITSEGPSTAQSTTDALTTLVNAVEARQSTGNAQLVTGAQTFLNRLAATTTLDVRTIIPTTTASSLSSPIVISGTSASTGTTQSEAFVIDVRSLPSGSTIQLDNIEFASIIGSATVNGGAGENYAVGDDASQFISLGEGNDTLFGGDGNDTIGSSTGEDSINGEEGDDSVFGGEGNDTVIGGTGVDLVYGNQQDDILYGNQSDDTMFGGQDNDVAFGGQGNDVIYGNLGADSLSGQLGNDTIYGGQGDDLIYGGDADDALFGNLGSDLLSGGLGNDALDGGQGADVLYGGIGDDNLFGGDGADTLYGGAGGSSFGIDTLNGGDGDDVIYGGEGIDWIYSSSGADRIYVENSNGYDVLADFNSAAGDVIYIASNVNGSGIASFSDVQAAASDNADGQVELALGSGNFVRIIGVTTADLTSDMFQFF